MIFQRKIVSSKNWFVEGDQTPQAGIYNDRAAKKASRHFECEGGYVDGFEGVFRFKSQWAIAATESWGIVGCGEGFDRNTPDFSGTHGTVFRHEGQGDFIVASGAKQGRIERVGFWPVYLKTSGAEIAIKGRSNTNKLRQLNFNLPYRSVHIEDSVYTDAKHLTTYSPYGDAAHYVTGSPTTLSSHNEKAVFKRCNVYLTQRNTVQPAASTFKNYANNLAVTLGDYTEVNGHMWQATQGGTTASSGSGPVPPASWVLSQDRHSIFVADGSVIWGYYGRTFVTGWLADSGGDYMKVLDCESNAASAVKTVNTFSGGAAPKVIEVMRNNFDHCFSHTIWIKSPSKVIFIDHNTAGGSVRGTGICFEDANADEFAITYNHLSGNAGGNKTIIPSINGTSRIYTGNIEV